MEKTPLMWLFNKITEYPLDTWNGFWRIIPFGTALTIIFDYYIVLPLLDKYLAINLTLIKYIFFATFSVILCYIFYFFIKRLIITLEVSFSNKVNIVLAYNLESVFVLNEEKFQKKYKKLYITLVDQIRFHNLIDFVKIIQAPSDISLSNSSAEAKTKLGLLGSTLLVWGDVVEQKKSYFFRTKFSYEFGHSKKLSVNKARENVNKYIDSFINKGLYPSVKNSLSSFEENLFLTSLFILGFSVLTIGNFKKAKLLFEAFRDGFKNTNLITQSDFYTLNKEVKRFLTQIYFFEIEQFHGILSVTQNKDIIKNLSLKVIDLEPDNYRAHITLALLFELEGDRSSALESNKIAQSCATPYDYAHIFNYAYFYLSDGDFENAIKFYKTVPNNGQDINTYTSEVSNFMYKKFSDTSRLEFLFADGYVSYLWDDKFRGKKVLDDFILKATDPRFDVLVKEVNKTLYNY